MKVLCAVLIGACLLLVMGMASAQDQVQSAELAPPTQKTEKIKETNAKTEVKPVESPIANAVVASEDKKRLTVAEAVIPPSQRSNPPRKNVAAFWFVITVK